MNTYTWSVNKVQVAEDNLIVKVDLIITGTDGNNTASAAYACNLSRGDTFTPYEQLTEQQVLDWCFAPKEITFTDIDDTIKTIGKSIKDEGEKQVANQIQQQLAKNNSQPALPWQN
jgi:hypothetical protein